MMKMTRLAPLLFLLICFTNCVTIAPPSPMVTYGGPKVTPKNTSETAIAFGTGAALFDGAHTGAQGWFGRYKYGINDNWDIGMDILGAKRNDGLYLSLKGATRYQLSEQSRLELGIGVADDSSGKSLNGDIAYTIGTIKDKPWNFYTSFRLGYAKGVRKNFITLSGQTTIERDSIAPPNTFIGLINVGAQGKINAHQKFIFEGGYGYIFPKGEKSGPAFYLSVGLVFKIDESN